MQVRELLSHWPVASIDVIVRGLNSVMDAVEPKCERDRRELRVVKEAATSMEKLAKLIK